MGVRPATKADLLGIKELLSDAGLPVSGVDEIIEHFLVVTESENLIGAGAIEPHGKDGLVRSVVVAPGMQGRGVGITIVEALLGQATGDLYLLTETAESFFIRFGFSNLSRNDAPPELRASEEFRSLCPESASFMRRSWLNQSN